MGGSQLSELSKDLEMSYQALHTSQIPCAPTALLPFNDRWRNLASSPLNASDSSSPRWNLRVWGISRTPVTPNSSIFWERSPSLSPSHHLLTLPYPPLLSFINILGVAFDKVTSIAWIVHHLYTRVLTNPVILDGAYLSIYILRLYMV